MYYCSGSKPLNRERRRRAVNAYKALTKLIDEGRLDEAADSKARILLGMVNKFATIDGAQYGMMMFMLQNQGFSGDSVFGETMRIATWLNTCICKEE